MDGMLVHHKITPSIKFCNTHLYCWVERDTGRVKFRVFLQVPESFVFLVT